MECGVSWKSDKPSQTAHCYNIASRITIYAEFANEILGVPISPIVFVYGGLGQG